MGATHAYAGIAAENFKLAAEIHSYEDAERFLDDEPDWKELGPQMRVWRVWEPNKPNAAYFSVYLYETEIIRYYPDGTFSVDNGGHNTRTTRERLIAVLPEGFIAYHHELQLGLMYTPDLRMGGHAGRRDGSAKLWPLDHSKRIMPTTITIKED